MKKKKLAVKPIAVDTLSLPEICTMFKKSVSIAYPKSKGAIYKELKHISRMGRSNHKWIKTYEEYIGAKISFYLQKTPHFKEPKQNIGMTCRTKKGLILVTNINIEAPVGYKEFIYDDKWSPEFMIYSAHFCERFAERILKVENPTFKTGSEALMFNELLGIIRVVEKFDNGLEKIEIQYQKGQAYGIYDPKNKITFLNTIYSDDMLKHNRLEFKMDYEPALIQLFEKSVIK